MHVPVSGVLCPPKRAIAELRAFGYFLVSGTGRKQSDVYGGSTEDVIGDIQGMIGCTAGGVPFASREEIAGWIGDERGEMDDHYPRWLRGQLKDDLGELEHYE